jgi:hypothetical protein
LALERLRPLSSKLFDAKNETRRAEQGTCPPMMPMRGYHPD